MIKFQCAACNLLLQVRDEKAGQRGKCPNCGEKIKIPVPPPEAADAPTLAPPSLDGPGPSATDTSLEFEGEALTPRPRLGGSFAMDEEPSGPPPENFGDDADALAAAAADNAPAARTQTKQFQKRAKRGSGQKVPGRPFRPALEGQRRTRFILILGGILVFSFLAPIFVKTAIGMKIALVSFTLMGSSQVPLMAKIMVVYPLIAGVLVLVLGMMTLHPIRGYGMIALGVVPVLVPLFFEPGRAAFSALAQSTSAGGWIAFLVMTVATWALYIGTRTRFYRPDNPLAYKIALAGAVCAIVTLVIPENEQVPFVALLQSFQVSVVAGLLIVLALLMLLGSAGLCIYNTMARPLKEASRLANWAFWAYIGYGVVITVGIMALGLGALTELGAEIGFADLAVALSGIGKFAASVIGVMLLTAMGVTDVLVGPVNPRENS